MFLKLLLLFTLVPMVELALLIKIGSYVGLLPTIFLVAITGVVGVSLARNQGFLVVSKIRSSLSAGDVPADSLIDGLLILIGGVMLLTPGILTDVSGFSLIIPGTRSMIRTIIKNKFKDQIKQGNISFNYHSNSQNYNSSKKKDDEWDDLSDSIDVDFEEIDE